MNFKTIFPMSAVLLTMIVLVGSKEAKAVELGITVGGGHHYRNGGVVEYRPRHALPRELAQIVDAENDWHK